ncbi:MAG TPA: GAF domain-containing protein [Thermomicrobiales bacterium]|nr:GAF domain-containing protein [Thermomicrobiales bacterium]
MTVDSVWHSDLFGRDELNGDVLLDFLRATEAADDSREPFDAFDQALTRLVTIDRLSISCLDRRTDRATVIYERGISLSTAAQHHSVPATFPALVHQAVQENRPVYHTIPDHDDVDRQDGPRRQAALRQALAAPVFVDADTAAVLVLSCTSPAPFSTAEARVVETFARVLGLALASHDISETTGHKETSREISRTIDRLMHTSSTTQLLDELQRVVIAITDATVLLFQLDHRNVRFVEARNPQPDLLMGQSLDDVGEQITSRVAELLAGGLSPGCATTLFTDPRAIGDAGVPVRTMDACHDLLAINAAAISVLDGHETSMWAMIAAWPETVSPVAAARHAESIDRLVRPAGALMQRLARMESLEQQVVEMDITCRPMNAVARTPRLQDAFEVICRTSQLVTNLDFVAIAETVNDHVFWHAATGAMDPSFLGTRVPVPPRILRDFLQHSFEVLLEDVHKEPDMTPEIMPLHTRERLRSTVILPVHVNARPRGAMVASQRHLHTFSPAELSLLHHLAGAVATAIAANDARLAEGENE